MTDPAPVPAPAPAQDPPALTEDQRTGRLFLRWNAGALVVGLVALGVGAWLVQTRGAAWPRGTTAAWDPAGFAADARWDDGRAEVARYRATRTLYGQPREYELVRLVVKEPYDPRAHVKPDAPGPGAVATLKAIAVHDVPTGRAYRYRQQVVLHVPRADPRRALGASMSSQEWCGNTFVRLVREAGALHRAAHSYWDGEGERRDALPADAWLLDQLPLTLRAVDWEATPTLEVPLLPALLSNKAPATRPASARLAAAGREELTVPAGTFPCVRVTVTQADEVVGEYWIGTGPGRPLVRFRDATGEGALTSLARAAYWEDPQ